MISDRAGKEKNSQCHWHVLWQEGGSIQPVGEAHIDELRVKAGANPSKTLRRRNKLGLEGGGGDHIAPNTLLIGIEVLKCCGGLLDGGKTAVSSRE